MPDGLKDILARQEKRRPVRCPVGRFLQLEGVEKGVVEGVRKALGTDHIYATTIAEYISEHGVQVGEKAVRAHRRGACSCTRRS